MEILKFKDVPTYDPNDPRFILVPEELPNGEVVSHAEMEGRLVERYTQRNMIPSTITSSYREQLEEAYKALNRERGFRHQYGAARRPRIKR